MKNPTMRTLLALLLAAMFVVGCADDTTDSSGATGDVTAEPPTGTDVVSNESDGSTGVDAAPGPVDPCDPNPCVNPPSTTCKDNAVMAYEDTGVCTHNVEAGTAECEFTALDPVPCGDDEICTSGICAQPGDPASYEFADDASYVSSLTVPMDAADGDCCFDYNADGEIDNKLGTVLKALKTIFDANEALTEAVEGGDVNILFEYVGLDSATDDDDISMNGFFGETDAAYADNISGSADFEASDDSFLPGTATPLISFQDASIAAGVLSGGPALFVLSLPLLEGVDLVLNVHETRIEAQASAGTAGEAGDRGLNLTEGKLGGVIPMEELYAALNGYVSSSCDCLGLGEEPWLGDGSGGPWLGEGTDVKCSDTAKANKDNCDSPDDEVCNQLAGFCSIIVGVLGPDIDQDNNGLDDSLSVGLMLEAVSANITGVAGAGGDEPEVEEAGSE